MREQAKHGLVSNSEHGRDRDSKTAPRWQQCCARTAQPTPRNPCTMSPCGKKAARQHLCARTAQPTPRSSNHCCLGCAFVHLQAYSSAAPTSKQVGGAVAYPSALISDLDMLPVAGWHWLRPESALGVISPCMFCPCQGHWDSPTDDRSTVGKKTLPGVHRHQRVAESKRSNP